MLFGEIPNKTRKNERSEDEEYLCITSDIEENEDFRRLKEFRHHDGSILNHVEIFSYLSYRICKRLGLGYRFAARGGLLHDFFLYDWRNHDVPDLPKEKYHGLEHPKIALKLQEVVFFLNEIERNIILKHMWPMTITPPKYKESYIVTLVDRYVASKEFLNCIGANGKVEKE